MWSRGYPRQRRAVLAALSAVGDTGMSVLALGVALDLPEPQVTEVLDRLVRSGRVGQHEEARSARNVPFRTRYQLTTCRRVTPAPPAQRRIRSMAGS